MWSRIPQVLPLSFLLTRPLTAQDLSCPLLDGRTFSCADQTAYVGRGDLVGYEAGGVLDKWCQVTCQSGRNFCPESLCQCGNSVGQGETGGEVLVTYPEIVPGVPMRALDALADTQASTTPSRTVIEVPDCLAGVFRAREGAVVGDSFCQSNCSGEDPYCPTHLCECGDPCTSDQTLETLSFAASSPPTSSTMGVLSSLVTLPTISFGPQHLWALSPGDISNTTMTTTTTASMTTLVAHTLTPVYLRATPPLYRPFRLLDLRLSIPEGPLVTVTLELFHRLKRVYTTVVSGGGREGPEVVRAQVPAAVDAQWAVLKVAGGSVAQTRIGVEEVVACVPRHEQ